MRVPRLQLDEVAEAVVDAYRNYELTERRLGVLTVTNACYLVRKFLAWRAPKGRPPPGHSATGTIALFGVAGLTSALAAPGLLLARQRRRRRHQAPGPPPGAAGASNELPQPPTAARVRV
jgi:hypothetical protein